MFQRTYFPSGYFPPSYWPKEGSGAGVIGGGGGFYAGRYYVAARMAAMADSDDAYARRRRMWVRKLSSFRFNRAMNELRILEQQERQRMKLGEAMTTAILSEI